MKENGAGLVRRWLAGSVCCPATLIEHTGLILQEEQNVKIQYKRWRKGKRHSPSFLPFWSTYLDTGLLVLLSSLKTLCQTVNTANGLKAHAGTRPTGAAVTVGLMASDLRQVMWWPPSTLMPLPVESDRKIHRPYRGASHGLEYCIAPLCIDL